MFECIKFHKPLAELNWSFHMSSKSKHRSFKHDKFIFKSKHLVEKKNYYSLSLYISAAMQEILLGDGSV